MVVLNKTRMGFRIVAAAAIGATAWNGHVAALALLPLIVWIWRDSRSRFDAFLALFAYYLGAGRGLLAGASVFFTDPFTPPAWWAGVLIWTAPSALLAGTWAAGWGTSRRGLRLLVILAALALPPIGIVGWANPLTAAGALFPGTGWTGLGLLLALLVVVAEARRPTLLYPCFVLASVLNVSATAHEEPQWIGLDTRYGPTDSTEGEFERLRGLQRLVLRASREAPDGAVFVLPEAVGGAWTVNAAWWQRVARKLERKRQTVLVGAKRPDEGSRQYVNILVSLGNETGVEFASRVPVPIGMWTPYRDDGAKTAWWETGISVLNGQRAASLVCYEQLLVWPVLVSMAHRPEVLVGASNDWWAIETNIPDIQRQAVVAWGRLFGVPTVYAANL